MWPFFRNLLLLASALIVQTMILAKLSIKPDLFVVVLVWMTVRSRFFSTIGWGLVVGLTLDYFAGNSLFYTIAYTAAALTMASLPRGIFKDTFSLGLVNVVLGVSVVHLVYALLTGIVWSMPLYVPWWAFIVLLAYDLLIYFLGTRIGGSWNDAV